MQVLEDGGQVPVSKLYELKFRPLQKLLMDRGRNLMLPQKEVNMVAA